MSLKARDIAGHMKAHGIEKGTVLCMQVLAEEQGAMREAISNLAEMMDQLSDIIVSVTQVTGQQQTSLEKVQKVMGSSDNYAEDGAPTTRDGH